VVVGLDIAKSVFQVHGVDADLMVIAIGAASTSCWRWAAV
jgi:hypothetical protein